MSDGRRLPVPTEDSQPFWAGCREGVLRFQRCAACGELNWFPRRLCRGCMADELVWSEVSGTGTVYSYSIIRRPPSAEFPGAYALALVDLDDGPRMMTHVVGPLDDVRIGRRVSVEFESLSEEIALPVFRVVPD